MSAREDAAEAIVRSIRTGERCFSLLAEPHLADDAVYAGAKATFEGKAAVLDRISGQWSMAPVLAAGSWEIRPAGDGRIEAHAEFPGLGAAPQSLTLAFSFDADDRVVRIAETLVMPPPARSVAEMSAIVRRRIDRALAEGKPIVLGYTDDMGAPSLSLRGSLQSYDGKTLCLWIRDAKSGLVRAIEAGRPLSFLYRDSATRTTMIGKCYGEIVADPVARNAIYDRMPEVEQRHDIARSGGAALIHIESLRGTSPEGPLLIETGFTRA